MTARLLETDDYPTALRTFDWKALWELVDGTAERPNLARALRANKGQALFNDGAKSEPVAEFAAPTRRVVSRFVWKREMAHSSGWGSLTTNQPPCRAAVGGMRHGAGYQEASRNA